MKDYKTLGYIVSSTYRTKAVKNLQDGRKLTPTKLAQKCKIRTNHISKVLKELKENNVAKCLNEQNRKGRIYELTPLGEEIAKQIEEME